MSYKVKRVSKAPGSTLRILIDAPAAEREGKEAGLALGGSFMFAPAGQDGDTAEGVSEYAARLLVKDHPGHFEVDPPLPAEEPVVATTAVQDGGQGKIRRKRAPKGGATS